jgi:hypothetical protein
MDWITRERSQIDRITCPWLIKNFMDSQAIADICPILEVGLKVYEALYAGAKYLQKQKHVCRP